jgi:ADP-heptose:LPS heptosyltransferase
VIDWSKVRRVLVVRLRSIGDTVLATPSLIALKRFLPQARVDILLEDWVAPLLEGFEHVDEVVAVGRGTKERLRTAWKLRRTGYDVVFNLHGGTTSTFFTRATGARHRVGYSDFQYSFLYNHRLSSSSDFWGTLVTHSAEQQLALLGHVGVPVDDRPRSSLTVSDEALHSVEVRFEGVKQSRELLEYEYADGTFHRTVGAPGEAATNGDVLSNFALIHPAAAFATKQWAPENFARVAEYLAARGIKRVAIAAKNESGVLRRLTEASRVPVLTLDNLSLPEITALVSRAKLFVGNDSGIAHIAAAVGTPTAVIFGSSNRNHWRPWTDAPNEIVFEEFACQPCAGYECTEFGEPNCILSVRPEKVITTVDRLLDETQKSGD